VIEKYEKIIAKYSDSVGSRITLEKIHQNMPEITANMRALRVLFDADGARKYNCECD
jgi:hypothetical protein